MDIKKTIKNIPKAELHAHLEGTVTKESLKQLANKNKVDISSVSFEFKSFLDFISLYLKITESIKTTEDIVFVAKDYLAKASEQSIVSAELYFSPTSYLGFNTQLEPLFEGLVEAQRIAKNEYQINLSWIFDIVRNAGHAGEKTIQFAKKAREAGAEVKSIGLAGYEAGHPARDFEQEFARARAEGFRVLAHAGETAGAESVRETIEFLKPDRIGHGIRALEDKLLVEELIESQIPIEVSPWSNILLNISTEENHPIKQMIDSGLNVIIAADDPGIFGKNLIENCLFAYDKGITMESIEKICKNSLRESLK